MGTRRRHTERPGPQQTVRQNGQPIAVQQRGQAESIDHDFGLLRQCAVGEDSVEFDCAAAQRAHAQLQKRNHSIKVENNASVLRFRCADKRTLLLLLLAA